MEKKHNKINKRKGLLHKQYFYDMVFYAKALVFVNIKFQAAGSNLAFDRAFLTATAIKYARAAEVISFGR